MKRESAAGDDRNGYTSRRYTVTQEEKRKRERIEKRESETGRNGSSGGDSSRGNCGCDGASVGRHTHALDKHTNKQILPTPSVSIIDNVQRQMYCDECDSEPLVLYHRAHTRIGIVFMRNRPTLTGQTPIEQTAMCGAQHEEAVTKKEVGARGTDIQIVAIGSTGCANDQLGTPSHIDKLNVDVNIVVLLDIDIMKCA
ncbi:hypothetical protein EAG_07020 [Camponotus floridanus]|uniref:Uncharacterized protein n=1 Tax=Camponotus floridanus TaxID=104421 RepID=E2AA18_CAMFO|nr:hypothetical protein EAG_07020 [Camponotus floridanus]